MKLFQVDFSTLILRFYLIMAIVIGAFFLGQPWLAALSLPVFFITLMGIKFSFRRTAKSTSPTTSPATQNTQGSYAKGIHQPTH